MATTYKSDGTVEVHEDDRTPADDPARRQPAPPTDEDPAHRETGPATEIDAATTRTGRRARAPKKTTVVKQAEAQRRTRVGKHKQ
jgi:hypothetical protein